MFKTSGFYNQQNLISTKITPFWIQFLTFAVQFRIVQFEILLYKFFHYFRIKESKIFVCVDQNSMKFKFTFNKIKFRFQYA